MSVADAIRLILNQEGLPPDYARTCDQLWDLIAYRIASLRRAQPNGIVIGINGPQGSGKSTMSLCLEAILREEHSLNVATLSIDDLYLTRSARTELANTVHPLFETRGVPGTHDIALGMKILNDLLFGEGEVALPRFEKSLDERLPKAKWPVKRAPVDIILFEGWCVALGPEDENELQKPINALEAQEDPHGNWRDAVNSALGGEYALLFGRIDVLIYLQTPGFEKVREWRMLQEQKLRRRTGLGMTDSEIGRFIQHYERLTRHGARTLPQRADFLVEIDDDHKARQLIVEQRPKK